MVTTANGQNLHTTFPISRSVRLLGISYPDLPSTVIPPGQLGYTVSTPAKRAKGAIIRDQFIQDVLDQAVPFIDSAAPKNTFPAPGTPGPLWTEKMTKKFKECPEEVHTTSLWLTKSEIATSLTEAPQDQRSKSYSPQDVEDEWWFCRRSIHNDEAMKGSANWDEFMDGFRDNHAQAEMGWAPDVVAVRKVVDWKMDPNKIFETKTRREQGKGDEVDPAGAGTEKWRGVQMYLVEIKHKLSFLLSDRVFPELLVIAENADSQEIIIISVPVTDMKASPKAELSKENGVVLGKYSAVERIRKVPGTGGGRIEWLMATASSAEGMIPQWATNMGLGRMVADDVKYFMEYIEKCRQKNTDTAGNCKKKKDEELAVEKKIETEREIRKKRDMERMNEIMRKTEIRKKKEAKEKKGEKDDKKDKVEAANREVGEETNSIAGSTSKLSLESAKSPRSIDMGSVKSGRKRSVERAATPKLIDINSGSEWKPSLEAAASTAAIAGTTMAPSAVKAERPKQVWDRTECGRHILRPSVPSPQA